MRAWGLLFALALGLGCRTEPTPVERTLKQNVEQMQARSLPAAIELRCSHPDAEVSIDGVTQGRCDDFDAESGGLVLDDQPHRLEVTKKGFRPYRAQVQSGGARTSLNVELTPL